MRAIYFDCLSKFLELSLVRVELLDCLPVHLAPPKQNCEVIDLGLVLGVHFNPFLFNSGLELLGLPLNHFPSLLWT